MVVRADADFISENRENKILYYEPETARAYDIDTGVMAHLVSEGTALLIPNMQADQDLEIGAERKWGGAVARSYLGVILKAKGKAIGSIELISKQPNKFNQDNSRLLTSIAVQAAIEVQNVMDIQKREQQLEQQILNMEIVLDEDRQEQQVEAIMSGEYFQNLLKQNDKKDSETD
jgi:GAF domain-containing protein